MPCVRVYWTCQADKGDLRPVESDSALEYTGSKGRYKLHGQWSKAFSDAGMLNFIDNIVHIAAITCFGKNMNAEQSAELNEQHTNNTMTDKAGCITEASCGIRPTTSTKQRVNDNKKTTNDISFSTQYTKTQMGNTISPASYLSRPATRPRSFRTWRKKAEPTIPVETIHQTSNLHPHATWLASDDEPREKPMHEANRNL